MRKLKFFLYMMLFFLFSVLIVCSFLAHEFLSPRSMQPQKIKVSIPPGATASEVAQELQEKKVIRHAWSFELLVKLTKTGGKIKSGLYLLSPTTSPYEILRKLVKGESLLVKVTIPEGFTLREIASLLGSKKIVDANGFLNSTRNAVFYSKRLHIAIHGLEGFLFPDTYEFSPSLTPKEAYTPMIERFKALVIPLYEKSHTKESLKNIITIASLVEKEAAIPKERPLIAAVIYNRLKRGMPLQCDATIEYLLKKTTVHLTTKDFLIPSPYNTYLHTGLPPGPIANPGLASIKAALYPAHVPYLYYVAKGDGSHRFSTTYQEHLHNVRLYEKWLSKHEKE
jgi:UPF0755 protein